MCTIREFNLDTRQWLERSIHHSHSRLKIGRWRQCGKYWWFIGGDIIPNLVISIFEKPEFSEKLEILGCRL